MGSEMSLFVCGVVRIRRSVQRQQSWLCVWGCSFSSHHQQSSGRERRSKGHSERAGEEDVAGVTAARVTCELGDCVLLPYAPSSSLASSRERCWQSNSALTNEDDDGADDAPGGGGGGGVEDEEVNSASPALTAAGARKALRMEVEKAAEAARRAGEEERADDEGERERQGRVRVEEEWEGQLAGAATAEAKHRRMMVDGACRVRSGDAMVM